MRLIELHIRHEVQTPPAMHRQISNQDFDLRKFESDCKPFLEAIKGSYHVPYHGSYSGIPDWIVRALNWTRGPRDTPNEVHDSVNDFFEEKFGWRARSQGIFVTGSANLASMYGKLFVIMPIGEFQSLWSPDIDDLTSQLENADIDLKYGPSRIEDPTDRRNQAKINTIEKIKKSKWHYKSHLKEALKTNHEIILGSKDFYLFRQDMTWIDTVYPFLVNEGYLSKTQ